MLRRSRALPEETGSTEPPRRAVTVTTAFEESAPPEVAPIRSGSMAERLAEATVPLLGGSAPSTRPAGAARRATFVPRCSERLLVPVATACFATGGVALAVGVTMLL